MHEDLDFLPFNMTGVKPKSGFDPYPLGIYLLEIKSSESRTSTSSGKMYRNYKSEIIMGPGWSQEYAGKPVSDMITLDEDNMGRHADLFQAAFGGEEAYNQLVAQYAGKLSAGLLNGRRYIAQLTISKDGARNFVGRRLPYTEENWRSNAGEAQSQGPGIMQPQQYAAPAQPQQYAAPQQYQQAPNQQMAAPMAPPQAPPPVQMQPPMQQFQAPSPPPAVGAPQWPAPPVQQQQGAPAYPAPPPPPGAPAGGSQQ
jgi:hypothetical protein